ncbi:hypothetical protein DPMN_162853 [Dreissena polymorpha]|uniref:Uncharacterized protein n=1 Tax=Dreissena polymorpha TaxID=45954 RepID=A0A9D4ER21_DREPO|nr:hypothetical protein DPMN_162853 [Dreissena polymorpha]
MLGCVHALINLLRAIRPVMEGTGPKNILNTVYGENSIVHIITEKAVQRACLQVPTQLAHIQDPKIQILLVQA